MTPSPSDSSTRTREGFSAGLVLGLSLSGVFALVVAVGGFIWLKRREADVRKGWNLVPVVVAAVDIPENTVVTMEMVSQRSVPEQFVTSSVVKPDSASYIVNQKVLVPLQAGDPLLWSTFETTRAAERLGTKLEHATRAYAVKVTPETSAGGWVRPNDRVDVIASWTDGREPVSQTVLQNVQVLATGVILGTTNVNLVPENDRRYSSVTLALRLDEAEKLALYETWGTVRLVLRPEGDDAGGPPRPRVTPQSLGR